MNDVQLTPLTAGAQGSWECDVEVPATPSGGAHNALNELVVRDKDGKELATIPLVWIAAKR